MKARLFTAFVILVTGMAVLFLGPPIHVPPAEASNNYYYDFERPTGESSWVAGTDYGGRWWRMLSLSTNYNACPPEGNFGATLTSALWHPHPVVWMVTGYSATGPLDVTLDWRMKGISHCEHGCFAMAYVGKRPPTYGQQFVEVGQLKDQWQAFHYEAGFRSAEYIYVALGFRATPESDPLTIAGIAPRAGVDCIRVDIDELGLQ